MTKFLQSLRGICSGKGIWKPAHGLVVRAFASLSVDLGLFPCPLSSQTKIL